MTIAYRSLNSASATVTAGNDLTITAPAGIVDDDVLLAFVFRDAAGGNLDATTFPAGFTKLTAISVGTTADRDRVAEVGWKKASSESGSYLFTLNDPSDEEMHGVILVYSGCDTTDPIDVTPTASHYGWFPNIPPQPTSPAIVTATDGAMVVLLVGSSGNTASREVDGTPPTNYTVRHGASDPIANAFIGAADRIIASASTETPGAWTIANAASTDDGYASTVALKAAVAGAGNPHYYYAQQ